MNNVNDARARAGSGTNWSRSPLGIAILYALFGVVWILTSDRIVSAFFPYSTQLVLNSVKGTCYVVITALLLYFLVRRSRHALEEHAKALGESEQHYRLLAENSSDVIWTMNFDGKFTYISPSVVNLRGFTAEEIMHQPLDEVVSPSSLQLVLDGIKAGAEQSGSGVALPAKFSEVEQPRKDGTTVWTEVATRLMYDNNNRPIGIIGISRDITERRRATEALQAAMLEAEQARAVAEKASRAKDDFLAVLSHELRTPLSPVLATVQLLQSSPDIRVEIRSDLEIIRRNIELEAKLIDDLLDLTRIASGKIELQRKTVDIGTIVDRVIEICKPDIESRDLHLKVEITEPCRFVNGDPARLQQLLWNVLKNSIKFTPNGGSIQLRCLGGAAKVIVEVIDSGIGIDPEVLPRLFNAFEQGDSRVTRQFGGLGLGLAISKQLAEMHGGTISAFSRGKGFGATFRIELPEAKDLPQEAPANGLTAPNQSRRILLVEDHADTAMMLRRLLQKAGYHIEHVPNVQQALSAIAANTFDVLISDLALPDRSGHDLMREIRRQGIGLKGLVLSGFGREDDVNKSKEAGFDGHLVKPVDIAVLIRAVEDLF